MKFLRKSAEAARLLAEDRMTREAICTQVGISRGTLYNWEQDEDFNSRVASLVNDRARRAFTMGLARKERRLEDLNSVYDKLFKVIEARGKDGNLSRLPGGDTGLVVMNIKAIGSGDKMQVVPIYEVDTAIIKSILDIQERVGDELGQKIRRYEMSGPNGEPLSLGGTTVVNNNTFIALDLERLPNEQLRQLQSIYESYLAGDSGDQRTIEAGRPEPLAHSGGAGKDQVRPGQP